MKRQRALGLVLALFVMGCAGTNNAGGDVPTITVDDTYARLGHDTSCVVLDVRTPTEYKSSTGHLDGAVLIPVDTLENQMVLLEPYRSKTIIAYCRTGVRSARAQRILAQHGFRAVSMAGGITRWNNDGLPIVKEPQQ